MDFYELTDADIPKPEQPTIVLETETEELGITAGPQDRVIAVYGGVVVMDFSEEAHARNGGRHGDYRPLPPELLPPLFVAWDERLSKSSGTVHNAMRYRAAIEHDPAVIEAMARKAALWWTRRWPPCAPAGATGSAPSWTATSTCAGRSTTCPPTKCG